MDRYFLANVATAAPTLPAGAVKGFPQDGDLATNKLPTIPGAYAFWQVFAELLNLQTAGGVTADAATLTQVATAVQAIAASAAASAETAAIAAAAADATSKASAAHSGAVSDVNAEFTGTHQQLGVNGWQDFPGGLIRQRKSTTVTPSGVFVTITYPKAFPHTCYGPRVQTQNSGATSGGANNFVGVELISFTLVDCVVSPGAVVAGGPSVVIMLDVEGD